MCRHLIICMLCLAWTLTGQARAAEATSEPTARIETIAEQARADLRTYRLDPQRHADRLGSAVAGFARVRQQAATAKPTPPMVDLLAEIDISLAWCTREQQRRATATTVTAEPPAASKPVTPSPVSEPARPALPDAAELTRAIDALRANLDLGTGSIPAAKAGILAERLLAENDAAANLMLALQLAERSGQHRLVFDAAYRLEAAFSGCVATDLVRASLVRMPRSAGVNGYLAWLEQPDSVEKNGQADKAHLAGRFLCCTIGRWDLGLPALQQSSDDVYRAAADLDAAVPETGEHRTTALIAAGDAWHALAGSSRGRSDRVPLLTRALRRYREVDDAPALVRKRISDRIDEIDAALPLDMDQLDWSQLTERQWDKLPGTPIAIQAKTDTSGGIMRLAAGQQVRVVPHPTDTWVCAGREQPRTCGWHGCQPGTTPRERRPFQNFRYGALLVRLDRQDPQVPGIISGPGVLSAMPNRSAGTSTGQIRIKLIPITDP